MAWPSWQGVGSNLAHEDERSKFPLGVLSWEASLRSIIFAAPFLLCQVAMAETVQVKCHGAVSLEAFACADVIESSDVSGICYDKIERYMVIRLKTTYYHYCEIDAATVQGLRTASFKRQYFESRIRGSGADGPFDCRTHPIPKKYRL